MNRGNGGQFMDPLIPAVSGPPARRAPNGGAAVRASEPLALGYQGGETRVGGGNLNRQGTGRGRGRAAPAAPARVNANYRNVSKQSGPARAG